jgi:hypothetical protein
METLNLPPLLSTRDPAHCTHSSLREAVIEASFLAELLRTLWCAGRRDVEVLHAAVDYAGYDLVLESGRVVRHVQLKSSHRNSTRKCVDVNIALAAKPSGCVIWVFFDEATMEIGPFLWFGAAAREPLPDLGARIGRHSKGDREGNKKHRPAIRELKHSRFERVPDMESLAAKLFAL